MAAGRRRARSPSARKARAKRGARPHRCEQSTRRPARLTPSRNPALVYLGTLSEGASREGARRHLNACARLLSNGAHDAETLRWDRLTYAETVELRRKLQPMRPASANTRLALVRGVLEAAFNLGLMRGDDYHRARAIKNFRGRSEPRGRTVTQSELRKVFAALQKPPGKKARRDAALLGMLYTTGARRAELLGVEFPRGLDLRAHAVHLAGKGRKPRTAHLPREVLRQLGEWLLVRGSWSGPLFCPVDRLDRIQKRGLSPAGLALVCEKAAELAKVPKFTPHDFRRTFGTELLDAGVDLHAVQWLYDHESLTTTARYDRGQARRAQRAVSRLPIPF